MATIRPEQPSDHAAIEAVNRQAFGQDAEAHLVAKLREADSHDPAHRHGRKHEGYATSRGVNYLPVTLIPVID